MKLNAAMMLLLTVDHTQLAVGTNLKSSYRQQQCYMFRTIPCLAKPLSTVSHRSDIYIPAPYIYLAVDTNLMTAILFCCLLATCSIVPRKLKD